MPAGRVRQVAAYYKCIYIRVIWDAEEAGHLWQVTTDYRWSLGQVGL